jgi:hypothetical protein
MPLLSQNVSPRAQISRPAGGEAQPSALTAVIDSASDGAREASPLLSRHASPRRPPLFFTAVRAGVAERIEPVTRHISSVAINPPNFRRGICLYKRETLQFFLFQAAS